ncbi:MAG: response regulator [Acidobacteria bacterium]|nr:response regulator [Acidobacteriota bacterium]
MGARTNLQFPRFLFVALAAALFAIIIGGLLFYGYQKRQQLGQVGAELRAIAQMKADQIADWREDQLFDAAAFQQDPSLNRSAARFLAEPDGANEEDLRVLFRNIALQHDYSDILLLAPTGQLLMSLSGHAVECDAAASVLAQAIRDRRPVFAEFHLAKDRSTPHLSWVAPLFAADGQPSSALVLIHDPARFLYPLLQSWPGSSRTSESLLVRRDGNYVLYLNELRLQKDTALQLRIPLTRTGLPAVMAALGQTGFVRGKDYRGIDVAAVIMPVRHSAWFIVSKMDAEEAFAGWRFRSIMILTLIAALIGAASLSGLAFWQLERKRHYRTLYRSETLRRQLSDIIERSVNEIFIFDSETLKFEHVNHGALTNLQYTLEEIKQLTPIDLKPKFTEASFRAMIRPLLDNELEFLIFETLHRRANGSVYPVEVHLQLINWDNRRVFLAVIFDITERKKTEAEREKLQAQLIQAQKMESVGRLAGGVAHDFNNLLSIILGYGEIMLGSVPMDNPYRLPLQEIHSAALRAKDLTRQLLAFSRKQLLEFRVVNINSILAEFENLLRRLLGEDIDLKLTLSSDPLFVSADVAQMEQVLMNLAVNARDAMPDGGTLTIATKKIPADELQDDKKPGMISGDYAMIAVSDTGFGMDREILNHVFEPFFTTKDSDKGTGLGLATSYGIVKQHGGHIWVASEPNSGTTFNIYLPLSSEPAVVETEPAPAHVIGDDSMSILLIEDDSSLRKLIIVILERVGYHVIESESVEDAIRKAAEYNHPIHLVLTDVVMPEMKGPEVFAKVAASHPEAKVLYMSGYTDDIIARQGVLKKGIQFIQKPFTVEGLLEKVEQALKQ